MSKLWLPNSMIRNVQIGEKERVFVLTHIDTGRILCFCRDDPFSRSFQDQGYVLHEIHHAHEYDLWAKRLREQAKVENEAQDYAYLERENETRQRLRKELKARLSHQTTGAQRQAVESALHCLDVMEKRRTRYRAESFMVQEGYEATANPGEEIINKVMVPKHDN